MDTTITRSYRLTEDIHDKIKEIAGEIGGNQQQAISKLIESYELQKGKVALSGRKNDIETFENYATALTKMYMELLTENENKAELVHAQFESQLTSKDSVITDLQQQLESAKEAEKKAVATANALQSENEQLNNNIDNLQNIIADKEQLNTALLETVSKQKSIITEMEEKSGAAETLKKEIEKYKTELHDIRMAMQQQELQAEKDMLALEKRLQAEKIAEVSKYQQLYMDLLQQQQQSPKEEVKEEKEEEKKTTRKPRKDKNTTTTEKND